jgi:hypothetical protein
MKSNKLFVEMDKSIEQHAVDSQNNGMARQFINSAYRMRGQISINKIDCELEFSTRRQLMRAKFYYQLIEIKHKIFHKK